MYEKIYLTCPNCGTDISIDLDLDMSAQKYIEDCEECSKSVTVQFSLNYSDSESLTEHS
jgi:transcription elongation factor Elf1